MKHTTEDGLGGICRLVKELKASGHKDKTKEFHNTMIKKYGEEDLSVQKGEEIIFTTNDLLK